MPLEILATMVVTGIILVVAVVQFSGLSKTVEIRSAAQAEQVFLLDFPETAIRDTLVGSDGKTAVLLLQDGQVGTVETMGDRFITRQLGPRDIAEVIAQDDQVVEVKFEDFTHKSARYYSGSPEAHLQLVNWFGNLQAMQPTEEEGSR